MPEFGYNLTSNDVIIGRLKSLSTSMQVICQLQWQL